MKRLPLLTLSMAIAFALPLNPAARAATAAGGAEAGTGVYIVVFDEPAVAQFEGFPASEKNRPRLQATAPARTGAGKLDPRSPAALAYRDYLGDLRRLRLNDAALLLGRELRPGFVYDLALNGIALELSAAEAAVLATQPGIKRVQPESVHWPMTDRGPAWVQAPAVWDGTATGSPRRGEGVVVGIVDSGVRPTHASLAATSAIDGYVHTNPRGGFYGVVGTGSTTAPKNNKLIGVWDFTLGTGDAEANDGIDIDGHGTHVATTVAGNPLDFTAGSYSARMSGVAPRANVISYKACEDVSLCRGAWTLASINQAIADQVDVINYSIGGSPQDPWLRIDQTAGTDDSAEAMLNARAAGIVVAVSAGNSGPAPGTHGSPANSPWVISAAAATHDRAVTNTLTNLVGGSTSAPGGGSLVGSGNTNLGTGTGLVPIVRDPNFPNCASGTSPGTSPPGGGTFPPGWNATSFTGMIVACERATVGPVGYARVEMAYNVQQAGGVGMILLNQDVDGLSTVADSYVIPMVHLSAADSQAMRTWLSTGGSHAGQLLGAQTQAAPSFGDRLASFSGRGPVPAMSVLKPNVAAPGVSVYAAGITSDNSISAKSGTSMAAPHVAGAAALLRSVNPSLTASQVVSALSLTARDRIVLPDASAADPHDQGAGMIDVARAARAGLYLEATAAEFRVARSSTAHTLNLPAIASESCFETCTLQRRFRLMPGVASGQYRVELELPAGASATPGVSTLSLAGADTATLDITFDVGGLANQWVYGGVTLVNTSGDGRPDLRLPVAIYSEPYFNGVAPAAIERVVSLERGHFDVDLSDLVAMPDARFVATGLAIPSNGTALIYQGGTDPYANIGSFQGQPTFAYYLGTIPATGPDGPVDYLVRANITSDAPNIDLFIGLDGNGDGRPALSEERCRATGPSSAEACQFVVRSGDTAQPYWVLVSARDAGGTGREVAIEYSAAAASGGATPTLVATGPGMTTSRQAFKLRLAYDAPDLLDGERRVANLSVQSRAGQVIADIPVTLVRNGTGVAPFALADGVGRTLRLPAGAAQDRLYFDVPPHATNVIFSTQSSANVDLYVARVDNAAATAEASIAPAPARGAAVASATTSGGNEVIAVGTGMLSPGRWYVTPVNTSGAAADVTVHATISASAARPGFRAGHYFNPSRPGHGAFIDFAGPAGNPDQWLVVWYTYLEDGTPTWYYTQGAAPGASGVFRGDLMRVVWNGASSHATDVGDVNLSELGAETIAFSYNLDGTTGSETLSRLGAGGGCPIYGGQALDASGHWYSPSLPGFGYSYQVTAGAAPQEVFVPYVYDGNGFPRWVYGQRAFDGSAAPIPLQWFDGFCPTCPAAGLVPTPVGTGTRSLVTQGVSAMSTTLDFTGALAGTRSTAPAPSASLHLSRSAR